MKRLAFLATAAAGVALALAGCSTGTDTAVSAVRHRGSVEGTAPGSGNNDEAGPPFPVGDGVEAGDRVLTAHHVAPVTFDHDLAQPTAGMEFYAIDVEACAASDSKGFALNPFEFEFQMPDNTRATAVIGWQQPSLNHTELAAGECVRGWVTLEVPRGKAPAALIYEELAVDGAKITWSL